MHGYPDRNRGFAIEQFKVVVFHGTPTQNVLNLRAIVLAEILHLDRASDVADNQGLAELIRNHNRGFTCQRLLVNIPQQRILGHVAVLILFIDLPGDLRLRLKICHLDGDIGVFSDIRISRQQNNICQQQCNDRYD
ncbi:hypothetical protein SDC9_189427 [bioreactor metagenome]|uniref:Uncharacterized protein n=1 Tax=bioreactor metagenome TaxID=1076179 RepID=A0A645HTS6_9ZZZZ